MSVSLVPLRTHTVVPSACVTGAIVSKTALPPVVQTGIKGLLVAFASGPAQHEDDRAHLIRAYAGACDGFELGVVQHVLGYLLYHNPRNPYRPSPQDVFELCEETAKTACLLAARFQLSFVFGLADDADKNSGMAPDHWPQKWGPRPDDEGCIIAHNRVMAEVRTKIQRYERSLVTLEDKKFEAIPIDAFPDGYREEIVKKRDQHVYELGLSHEERVARYFVLDQIRRDGFLKNEDEVRRRTAERLRLVQAEKGSDLP